jgi:hypothetical protein
MSDNKLNYLLISMDKLKEVQRIQYDYFKHLTTLSVGSIGVIATLVLKIMPEPKCIVLLIISLMSFLLCLLASLWACTAPGNAILYIVGIQTYAAASPEDPQKNKGAVEKESRKLEKSLDQIKFFDIFTKIVFLIGVVVFLIYIRVNLK